MPKQFIIAGHNEFTGDNGKTKAVTYTENGKIKIFEEFWYNVDVADRVHKKLTMHSKYDSIFHPVRIEIDNNKVDFTLSGRINYLKNNSNSDDLGVSIHANASSNKKTRGWGLFYSSEKGYKLLKNIENAINLNNFPTKKWGIFKCIKGTWTSFGIVLNTPPIMVLWEGAFFTNDDDRTLLLSDEFREKSADVIYTGICGYYGIQPRNNILKSEHKINIPDWKMQELSFAFENRIITDKEYWMKKIKEGKIAPEEVLAMLNNLYMELKK